VADRPIAARFAEWAARTPDALAIATGATRWTYAALADAVAALADRLRAHGAADHAVALALPHGAPLAIGVLATQRLGRPAVVVEPRMPAARQETILADAGAAVVVTLADGAAADAPTLSARDREGWKRLGHPSIQPPDRPALVLYTSGSTGTPNGVVYSERAILDRVVDRDRFALGPGDRVGVFGGAGMHLFRTLLRGAALVSWDAARDGIAGVAEWIAREEITVLHCLPTLFRRLTDAWDGPLDLPRLRVVSLTGEPVVARDVERFRRCFPASCMLVNGIGTTEAGTFCQAEIAHATGPGTTLAGDLVPVGHAVDGVDVLVCDEAGRPLPAGEVGEIVVRGALLAAGYWQRPVLEANRFGRDPYGNGPRRYRTGDLGRRTADGALVHLGRRDHQVKVRGARVEPAEVEAALMRHPSVRQVAVVGHEEEKGEARLVACVATADPREELGAELGRFLRTRLPSTLVPDGWTFVDALPLLPGGKVDRRALPLPPPRRSRRRAAGIVEMFGREAARRPDAIAYRCADEILTYADLDRRSAALAARLVAAGLGDQEVVVLALPREPAYAVALLAVLRAGGVCLPIDPNGPRERNEAMLRESGACYIVADDACGLGRDLARIDPRAAAVTAAAAAVPHLSSDPSRLAFLLYTSGSTGTPKGVEVTEGQILHRLGWDWSARPFRAGEVGCQRAAVGFVDAIAEWLGGLLQGVPTVILPDALLERPHDLVATLARREVTRILLVPSQLGLLLDTIPDLGARLPALRLWTVSGEPLPPATLARFRAAFPRASIWNVYGATEAWDATAHELRGEESPVPIGVPLPGMRAYLLDEALAPVALGVAGDLYVAGDGLARGYRGDAERTREKFMPNPFSPGTGDRLYRTGDRARRRDDGAFEHLGRTDRCVKLRGVRVELGEVEAVLAAHPGVREAAAVLLDGRLVAFVTPAAAAIDRAALDAWARDRLPRAAVPGRIVSVPALPRNDRGKVDRAALREPERVLERPRTELEETVAEIFADLLGRGRVGATEDFFDLGGDSLLAVQLVAELEALTGRAAALDAIAADPTPRGIAAILTADGFPWQTADCITLHPNGDGPPLFAICGAWGWAVRLLRVGRALGDAVPMHALQPPAMAWPEGATIASMAAHYADRIEARAPSGAIRLLGTSFGGILAFEVAVQLQARGRAVALLAMVDSAAPGSPLREPPPATGTSAIEAAGRRVYFAHLAASERYVPTARFAGRVLYFQCSRSVSRATPERWQPHATGGLEVAVVPGEHGQFHVEPQLGAIAAVLAGRLSASAVGAGQEPDALLQREHAPERAVDPVDAELA
jgi:amino acid adenylation domain-containing protein